MKVKLLVSRAGADFSNGPGEVVDVDASEGKALVESGQAEAVGEKPSKRAHTRKSKASKEAR